MVTWMSLTQVGGTYIVGTALRDCVLKVRTLYSKVSPRGHWHRAHGISWLGCVSREMIVN